MKRKRRFALAAKREAAIKQKRSFKNKIILALVLIIGSIGLVLIFGEKLERKATETIVEKTVESAIDKTTNKAKEKAVEKITDLINNF